MNKLLVALIAGAFASVSALASAQTQAPPTQPVPTTMVPLNQLSVEDAKAARAAAKARWDKMTPDEQAAVKNAVAKKKRDQLNAMEEVAADQGPVFDAKKAADDAKASKAQPLPTKQERQADVTKQSKGSTGQ